MRWSNGFGPNAPSVFKSKVKGGKVVVALYDDCHRMWRAGLIAGFYHGARSPMDPTVVWELNGSEVDQAEVGPLLAARRREMHVVDVAWGSWWCGYRAVSVAYTDGRTLTEAFDGSSVTVTESRLEVAS